MLSRQPIGFRETIEAINEPLTFESSSHTYKYGSQKLTSVSSLLKPYFPFDAKYVAASQIFERGKDGEFVVDEEGKKVRKKHINPKYRDCEHEGDVMGIWADKRDFGTDRHKFVEDYLNGDFVTVTHHTEMGIMRYLQKFSPDDVMCEVPLAAPEWGIAGTADVLYVQDGAVHIADTKTDSRISTEAFKDPILGKSKCTGVLSHLDNCNFNKYKFQLGIYALILQEFYDISIKSITVWHVEPSGKVVEYEIRITESILESIGLIINEHLNKEKDD